jgi:hypothetical protein
VGLWPYLRPGDEGDARLYERYARTLDPAALAEEIATAIAEQQLDEFDFDELDVKPLTIKQDRFLVLIDARAHNGATLPLIAKGYWDDRGRRVLANHRALWDAGLRSPADVRTPRPLGYLPELGALLCERLPGAPCDRRDAASLARAGEAAARLHELPATLEPRFEVADALAGAERHARKLERDGWAEQDVMALIERARMIADELGNVRPGPVHGDLATGNFLIDGRHTALIDWDTSCSFDPAWDVGHLLAQLRRFGLVEGFDVQLQRQRFLEAYFGASRNAQAELMLPRIALFEALACIHKAHRVQWLGQGDWKPVTSALLADASERLADAA